MITKLTDEQVMMREALARCLNDLRGAKSAPGKAGFGAPRWDVACKVLAADLGVLAVSFPQEHGGLGGGLADNLIVLEASARPQASGYVVNGHKSVVYAAPWATHLIVTARTAGASTDPHGISLLLLDSNARGIRRRDFMAIDGTAASEIFLEDVHVSGERLLGAAREAAPLIDLVVDEAMVALCSDAIGVLAKLNEDTVAYARQRRQCGRAIAEFQVLQHRMVDMYVELQQVTSIAAMASLNMSAPAAARAQAVSAAKWRWERRAVSSLRARCRFTVESALRPNCL
jgi:alkylation response protein AidB-like acyl-CoA dehydrogenase